MYCVNNGNNGMERARKTVLWYNTTMNRCSNSVLWPVWMYVSICVFALSLEDLKQTLCVLEIRDTLRAQNSAAHHEPTEQNYHTRFAAERKREKERAEIWRNRISEQRGTPGILNSSGARREKMG